MEIKPEEYTRKTKTTLAATRIDGKIFLVNHPNLNNFILRDGKWDIERVRYEAEALILSMKYEINKLQIKNKRGLGIRKELRHKLAQSFYHDGKNFKPYKAFQLPETLDELKEQQEELS